MSAYVTVHPTPPRIAVICPQCGINHEYTAYREAIDQCKEHNLTQHEGAIQWAN